MSDATEWLPKNLRTVVGLALFVVFLCGGTITGLFAVMAFVDHRATLAVAPVAADLTAFKVAREAVIMDIRAQIVAVKAENAVQLEALKASAAKSEGIAANQNAAINLKLDGLVQGMGALQTDVAVIKARAR